MKLRALMVSLAMATLGAVALIGQAPGDSAEARRLRFYGLFAHRRCLRQ
jgi:hypothetical protein